MPPPSREAQEALPSGGSDLVRQPGQTVPGGLQADRRGQGNGTRCSAKDYFSMTKDHGYRTTDEDADWSDVAMAAIAAIVLLGIPTICVLCR
jgi:hypothetical protein